MAKGDAIGSATGQFTDKLRADGAAAGGMQRMGQQQPMGMMQPSMQGNIASSDQNMMQPGMSTNSGMFGNIMPPQQGMMQQPPQTSMMQPPGWSQGLAGSGLMDHIRNLFGGQQQTVGTGKGGLWF